MEVGTYDLWTARRDGQTAHSDHVPTVIDFDL